MGPPERHSNGTRISTHNMNSTSRRRKLGRALQGCMVALLFSEALFVVGGQQQQAEELKVIEDVASTTATGGHNFCSGQSTSTARRTGNQKPANSLAAKKVFCFYDIQDDFRPQDLNPCLCTHVVYSYVAVRKNLSFIAGKKGDLRSLASLKRKNPNLKLLVSLRPDDYFSFEVAASPAADQQQQQLQQQQQVPQMNEMHQKFAKRVRDFIVRHSLDGINLDWPYFAQTMRSPNASRDHLTLALSAINENFASTLAQSSPSSAYLRLQTPIVTLTASKDFYALVDGYNFHQVAALLDYVHLPAFDFDLNVDQYSIGHPARLHGISDAENLDTLVDLLLSSGLPSEQLVAGIPSHGVQITSRPPPPPPPPQQASSTTTTTAATTTKLVEQGTDKSSSQQHETPEQLEAAANISIVSHSEVCRIRDLATNNCSLQQQNNQSTTCWTMSRSRDLTAPYAYDSEHWLGFDDETSAKLKAKYVLLRHLAGVAMFTVNNDDPQGTCGFGPYPLLSTVSSVFARAAESSSLSKSAQILDREASANEPSELRTKFTKAPNQILTATSLVSQIFGKKLASSSTPAPTNLAGDLLASASDQRETSLSSSSSSSPSLTSFVDIIEKYGAVHRLDANSADTQELPCNRVGYQRYPRDCSRFYRCVQKPPATQSSVLESFAGPSVFTRLQYECPSGLVFDEQYQICNWPSWSAQCTGSGEVNSITNSRFVCPNYGYFQNQENCEYFYYCSDYNRGQARAYQFRCPFELGFDEDKLQCNWKWLVKGCNTTSKDSSITQNEAQFKLAEKYLESQSGASSATSGGQVSTPEPTKQPHNINKRSVLSHIPALLASVDSFREHHAKKQTAANQMAAGSDTLALGLPGSTISPTKALQGTTTKKAGFRVRRRQGTVNLPPQKDPPQSSSSSSSSSVGLPYKRPAPPPSRLPFLPSNLFYMIADSFRSVGEAIQGELNRYLRIAGDQMRRVFGNRPMPNSPPRRTRRDTTGDEVGDLEALESGAYPQSVHMPHNTMKHRVARDPLARPLGYPLNQLDEQAKAAVLGPEPQLYQQPSMLISNQLSGISQQEYAKLIQSAREIFKLQQAAQQHGHMHYNSEPMYASGSQEHMQQAVAPTDLSHEAVVARMREQALSAQQNKQLPYGMPVMLVKPQPQPQVDDKTKKSSSTPKAAHPSKKRHSVASKLAQLAMPRFVTRSPSTTMETQSTSKSYMSFLPSFSSVVKAPARSFMSLNKAVQGLISTLAPGKANSIASQEAKHRASLTTPLPPMRLEPRPMAHMEFGPLGHLLNPSLNKSEPLLLTEQEARALSAQLDMLTKEQLEALSSALFPTSAQVPTIDQQQQQRQQPSNHPQMITQASQHHPQQHQYWIQHTNQQHPTTVSAPQASNGNSNDADGDYVSRLLKMLSQTSHNPEDVRLLDQLASQLSNPVLLSDQLVELGQGNDAALLEALGLVPAPKESQNTTSTNQPMHIRTTMPIPSRIEHLPSTSFVHFEPSESNMREIYYSSTQQPYELSSRPAYPTQPEQQHSYSYEPQPPPVVEKLQPVPIPVRQTFTEVIESNTTTNEGIESSIETRTKSAIGAGIDLSLPVGHGLVSQEAFKESNSSGSSFGYDFATQPVRQFEEVVIRKKFEPHAKQVLSPTQITLEEEHHVVRPVSSELDTSFQVSSEFQEIVPITNGKPVLEDSRQLDIGIPSEDVTTKISAKLADAASSSAPVTTTTKQESVALTETQKAEERLKELLREQETSQDRASSSPTSSTTLRPINARQDASTTPSTPAPKRKRSQRASKRPQASTGKPAVAGTTSGEKPKTVEDSEVALSNFMLEFQRSQQQAVSGAPKAKTAKAESKKSKGSKKKSRSKKIPTQAKEQLVPLETKPKETSGIDGAITLPVETVAIYGTKSGFMPIILPDDPNYHATRIGDQQRSASGKSLGSRQSRADDSSGSWVQFVKPQMRDQISVVNLGNYSFGNKAQAANARLIILPGAPNDKLLENWYHLSAVYPQLFPARLGHQHVAPIHLGPSSLLNSGKLDANLEDRRMDQFRQQFESLSRLMEQRTFRALDEIVQKASGRFFIMRRPDDHSRTIIAVIPNTQMPQINLQPPTTTGSVSTTIAGGTTAPSTSTTTTTTTTTTSTTSLPAEISSTLIVSPSTTAAIFERAPQRAAAFSRAVQESIQGAIRDQLDTMKEKLRRSLSSNNTNLSPTTSPTTMGTTHVAQWSTPTAEALASLENNNGQPVELMDVAGSIGTETTLPAATTTTDTPRVSTNGAGFSLQPQMNVMGAEPKSLYALDSSDDLMMMRQSTSTRSSSSQPPDTVTKSPVMPQSRATTYPSSARYLSIGAHLMTSPLQMPKVVDQAYVRHFYDHISDNPQSKAAGFDELLSGVPKSGSGEQTQANPASGEKGPEVQLSEDSLVPESACTRAGLFQHPFACNKFYECFWDKPLNRYTLHMFECPIKLAFDERIVGCSMPIESSLCVNY